MDPHAKSLTLAVTVEWLTRRGAAAADLCESVYHRGACGLLADGLGLPSLKAPKLLSALVRPRHASIATLPDPVD